MRNSNISQSNRSSGKSHLVLKRFVILWPSMFSSHSTKHPYAFTTSLNFELLSVVTFNEVGDTSSSFGKELKSYWSLWYCLFKLRLSVKKASLPRSSFSVSIVTQRSSKVEANQNTTFDKRIASKQKHKRANPFGRTWAFNKGNSEKLVNSQLPLYREVMDIRLLWNIY